MHLALDLREREVRRELQIERYVLLINHPEAVLKDSLKMPIGLENSNHKKIVKNKIHSS